MFEDPLIIIPLAAVLIVALILLTGIGSFGRGGEFNKRNANKIMRYRIYAQAVAIVLILGYVWLKRQGG
ncbi:twin transmembrane helix small protein [Maritimibacter sp. UBA3975]|uniref:twin transmembrane helix small protein n=1 Tax=Maritimibacter sp. UBA3975 TaxID=1946833 RepID=UPI000C09A2D4|nr:twin transmembrane helix small protein [Maritimibacter sp. UBA3975]MAM63764.1 hypothetical protein [Maritimibacter sp.]|tara:strand:+ start:9952 stop:10158 length:207 start_codon:yes stop_codon:yes gene_type:complete